MKLFELVDDGQTKRPAKNKWANDQINAFSLTAALDLSLPPFLSLTLTSARKWIFTHKLFLYLIFPLSPSAVPTHNANFSIFINAARVFFSFLKFQRCFWCCCCFTWPIIASVWLHFSWVLFYVCKFLQHTHHVFNLVSCWSSSFHSCRGSFNVINIFLFRCKWISLEWRVSVSVSVCVCA